MIDYGFEDREALENGATTACSRMSSSSPHDSSAGSLFRFCRRAHGRPRQSSGCRQMAHKFFKQRRPQHVSRADQRGIASLEISKDGAVPFAHITDKGIDDYADGNITLRSFETIRMVQSKANFSGGSRGSISPLGLTYVQVSRLGLVARNHGYGFAAGGSGGGHESIDLDDAERQRSVHLRWNRRFADGYRHGGGRCAWFSKGWAEAD